MLGKKLAIDLGTDGVRIIVSGEREIVEDRLLVRPLLRNRIADATALETLLRRLVSHLGGLRLVFKPEIVTVVPQSLNATDRRLLLDLIAATGARATYLLDAPLAMAMGAGISLGVPSGHLVVDIGAQMSEAVALSLEASVVADAIPRGGDDLVAAIQHTVAGRYGVGVTAPAVAELVQAAATAGGEWHGSTEIVLVEGEPIAVADLSDAVEEHVAAIAGLIRTVFEETPGGLAQDIRNEGVLLAGGGALLTGLAGRLSHDLGMAVRVAPDARWCAVRGAAVAVENLAMFRRKVPQLH